MDISGSVALVTGANRGLGRFFALGLLERGASKVYATARDPERVDLPGAEVLELDVTDPDSVAAAAAAATDVDLVVNNAGACALQNLVAGDMGKIRLEMETQYFGTLSVVRAFAPVLGANGGGAILNVLSLGSWKSFDGAGSYSASKAAQWSLTNGIRLELAKQGTAVTGLHFEFADTDMVAALEAQTGSEVADKSDPADVVRVALDGVEAGRLEVVFDDASAEAKAGLAADPSVVYPQAVAGA